MGANDLKPRQFPPAVKSVRGEEPLLLGYIGPPGGGKTVSALRTALGMKRARGGPVILIDTECGRSKKYSDKFDFLRVDFEPPFQSNHFLDVIRQQLPLKPSCIIVDSGSEEHEGEGGYLEWHDAICALKPGQPGYVGGNEWAAWSAPKAARKRLITGMLHIKVPMIWTFRAREKTTSTKDGNKTKITNIGWMPVAPLEIVHALDLVCLLPPRADGIPVWSSDKVGEDFIVKLPDFLQPALDAHPGQIGEDLGEALARWAMGETVKPASPQPAPQPTPGQSPRQAQGSGADEERLRAARIVLEIGAALKTHGFKSPREAAAELGVAFAGKPWTAIQKLPADELAAGLAVLTKNLDGVAELAGSGRPDERQPGEDDGD
jgi:hypothetical protein